MVHKYRLYYYFTTIHHHHHQKKISEAKQQPFTLNKQVRERIVTITTFIKGYSSLLKKEVKFFNECNVSYQSKQQQAANKKVIIKKHWKIY